MVEFVPWAGFTRFVKGIRVQYPETLHIKWRITIVYAETGIDRIVSVIFATIGLLS